MNLNFLKPKHCESCESPFPASALVNFEGDLFCIRCVKNMDKTTYYCEGCGEPFPKHHLTYVADYQAYFCKRCDTPEEGYKAWCGMCDDVTNHMGLHCMECEY